VRVACARGYAAPASASSLRCGVAALLLIAVGSGCADSRNPSPDRVVLVTIDTLRADRVGCYGDARARTPALDTLAAGGVRFEAAISPAPITLPAHASLMTALDPPRHAVRHNSLHRLGDAVPTLAESLRAQGFATGAFVGSVVLAQRYGLARGFDVYDVGAMERASSQTAGYAERPADKVVDAALAWVAKAPPRFFLWLHLYDPHAAYDPPAGFAAAFASDPYRGEIAFADHQVGRLLDAVRARFGADGLLVVATSDHGESLGEHGELRHSYGIYDATQRVPLILSGGGLPAGRVVAEPVRLVDVAPTLLAAVGAPPLPGVDGSALQPLLSGGADGERVAYVETFATRYDYGWSALQGLRSARFKYIRAPRPELYDLRADPGEQRDLAARMPEVVSELDAALTQRLAAPAAVAEDVALPESERARLRALGYVAPDPAGVDLAQPISGPDPKDEIGLLKRLHRAERLALLGRHADAYATLRDLEDPAPAVAGLRATLALKAGDAAAAERDARTAATKEPRRADLRLVLGNALEAQGRDADARGAYEEATRLDAESVEAWRGVERTALRLRDAAGAERAHAAAEALAAPGAAP
jgi:arylsulfatase A-like enzyme